MYINWQYYESLLKSALTKTGTGLEDAMTFASEAMPALEALTPEAPAVADVVNVVKGIMAVAVPVSSLAAGVGAAIPACGLTGAQAVNLAVGHLQAAMAVVSQVQAAMAVVSQVQAGAAQVQAAVKPAPAPRSGTYLDPPPDPPAAAVKS
jgi:hypothetical protein